MTATTCWQYSIKTRLKNQNPSVVIDWDNNDSQVLPLSWKEARDFIVIYEWLGNMGTSKYCFGLFLSGNLASVVCYGPLIAPSRYSNILGKDFSKTTLQLCRGASTFWAPKWAPSKLVSHSLKMLRQTIKVNAVVAYADPEAGEIGTIYQACNAYYFGKTSPGRGKRYIINGHSYDPRKVVKKFGSRAHKHLLNIDPHYKTAPIQPKHRYIFVVGNKKERKEILERIKPFAEEYPKRGKLQPTYPSPVSISLGFLVATKQ